MRDKLDCQMYVCNGVAIAYYQVGEVPTVEKLRENWNAPKYKDLSDESIQKMLNNLKRFFK